MLEAEKYELYSTVALSYSARFSSDIKTTAATTPRANNKNCVADNITGTFNQLSTQQALE